MILGCCREHKSKNKTLGSKIPRVLSSQLDSIQNI